MKLLAFRLKCSIGSQPCTYSKAVEALVGGGVPNAISPSRDYDVIVRPGIRLALKAVFGVAATDVLGFEVRPEHFNGGVGTICVRKLEESG